MFGKLIKHEWKATAGTMGILTGAAFGAAVLGALIMRFNLNSSGPASEVLGLVLGLVMVFALLAVVVCAVAAEVVLVVRYYRSRFTDEGYLLFTLPVNSHQIFLSAAVNMMIWSVITGLALFLSYVAFLWIGMGEELREIVSQFQSLGIGGGVLDDMKRYIWVYILQVLVAVPYAAVTAMTCITVGAVLAKKHKVMMSFGAYYVLNMVVSTVSSTASSLLGVSEWDRMVISSTETIYQMMVQQLLMVTVPLELTVIVGGYFLSTWLMKKKLNLP